MRCWVFACVCGVLAGCRTAGTFACNDASDCISDGADGTCQPNGYCSFPDGTCPSGQRYGEHASEGLAAECVVEYGDTGATSGGDSSMSSPETSATSTSGPSSASASEDSTGPSTTLDASTGHSTSTTASSVTDSADTTTGPAPVDPYGPCADVTECPLAGSTCLFGEEGTVCAPPCEAAPDCPASSGTIVPQCGPGVCVLQCGQDQPCPAGMACVSDGTCAWPP